MLQNTLHIILTSISGKRMLHARYGRQQREREREEKCHRMKRLSVIIMVSSGSIISFIARANKTGQQNGHGYPDQQLLRIP